MSLADGCDRISMCGSGVWDVFLSSANGVLSQQGELCVCVCLSILVCNTLRVNANVCVYVYFRIVFS